MKIFENRETIIKANTKTHIHYQNHLEAVYCVAGNGKIEDHERTEDVQNIDLSLNPQLHFSDLNAKWFFQPTEKSKGSLIDSLFLFVN